MFFFLTLAFQTRAQEINLIEGSFKMLLSEKTVDLSFTYDSLQVGKYKNESEYVNKKIAEINKKDPGKGDAWALEWTAQRKRDFEPAFIKAFKASSGKKFPLLQNTH